MNFEEMSEAVVDAKRTQWAFDEHIMKLAKLLRGNLRKVSSHSFCGNDVLCDLKRELSQYDAKKKEWKN